MYPCVIGIMHCKNDTKLIDINVVF